jgi:hypothetical protein
MEYPGPEGCLRSHSLLMAEVELVHDYGSWWFWTPYLLDSSLESLGGEQDLCFRGLDSSI